MSAKIRFHKAYRQARARHTTKLGRDRCLPEYSMQDVLVDIAEGCITARELGIEKGVWPGFIL